MNLLREGRKDRVRVKGEACEGAGAASRTALVLSLNVDRRQVNTSRRAIGAANSPPRRNRGEHGVLTCNHKGEFAIMELERTAIHEAGHAVVAYALGYTSHAVALTHDEVADTGYYGYVTAPHPRFSYTH